MHHGFQAAPPVKLTVGPVPGDAVDVQVVVGHLSVYKTRQLRLLPFLKPKVRTLVPKTPQINIWVVFKVPLLNRQSK